MSMSPVAPTRSSLIVPQRSPRIYPRGPGSGIEARHDGHADADSQGDQDQPERQGEELELPNTFPSHIDMGDYRGNPGDHPAEQDADGGADESHRPRFREEERSDLPVIGSERS